MQPPAMVTDPAADSPAADTAAAATTATLPTTDTADRVIDLTEGLEPEVVKTPKRVNPFLSLAVAVGVVWYAIASGNTTTLVVAVGFGAMIFLHELGHFLTARLTGMKTTEFFVGFGPRVWSFKRGEMEYGIKAIPLGGYVKILGMHNLDKIADPADEPRTYRQKSYPRRVLVASAGTLMHLLLAFVLMTTIYSGLGESVDVDGQLRVLNIATTLNGKPSPLVAAGIKRGDWLLAVNGTPVANLSLGTNPDGTKQSTQDAVTAIIHNGNGQPVVLTIGDVKTRTSREVTLTPVNVFGVWRVGFNGLDASTVLDPVSIPEGMAKSARMITKMAPMTFSALGKFFTPTHIETYSKVIANAGKPNAAAPLDNNRFLSPKGAVDVVKQASGVDYRRGLEFFAMMNIFVGIFNMMPTLPFDGGHVVIATYERLRSTRRKRYYADVTRLMPVVYVVMFVLMAIGISSLYLDIRNPL